MCGVAGELRFNSETEPKADWTKISSMMARRGPDDEGIWSDEGRCTLVFRRLAIIDLSLNGHQPMAVCNGRFVLVFNGEVYNFKDLRKRLESLGVQFRSNSDTEVVLYALIEWGIAALDAFNGMFALGFYDKAEKRLLLARDHAGIKPLYYLIRPQGVVFASQFNQLLAHPLSRNLGVSQEALGLYLRLAYIPAPYALLQDSHMLEPGTWIQFTEKGHVQQGQFFSMPRCETPSLKGAEAIEAVDGVIAEAVKRQLISDVPVGAFLSGGIDSPLVVAKMKSAGTGTIRTFTIGTGEEATDESTDAMRYARELGVEQTVEHVKPDTALDLIDNVIDACGEPFGDYSMFPTMMVSHLASRDYKVMLSGDGGDELFWGYPRFGSLIKMAKDSRLPRWWRLARRGYQKVLGLPYQSPYLPACSLGELHRTKLTHLPELWLRRVFPALPSWPSEYAPFAYTRREPNEVAQWSRWSEFVGHLPYVLLKVDRASMYHSLEVRVPLLDREVINVATQIDWRECFDVSRKIGKLPLRHALARHTTYQSRTKRGFEVPMGSWLRTSLRERFEESLLKRDEILGLEIERKALRELFTLHLKGERDYAWGLWPLFSLALWADKYYH
jgi:asparagine synthase (glutamine-hydrolysing)